MASWSDLKTTSTTYFPRVGTIVTFTGGGGSGAFGYAVAVGGVITSVNIIYGGTGYTSNPTPVFTGSGSGAAGTAGRTGTAVTSVTITAGGNGYNTGAPAIKLNAATNFVDDLLDSLASWRDHVSANGKNLSNLGALAFAPGVGQKISVSGDGWITPTLLNSWIPSASVFDAPAYRMDATGTVHVKGCVSGGAVGSVIFTLPAGYRPAAQRIFCTQSGFGGPSRIDVSADGNVSSVTGGNNVLSIELSFML